jgi:hypothetical protein
MAKKLTLEDLKVQSFVTTVDAEEAGRLLGGTQVDTTCDTSDTQCFCTKTHVCGCTNASNCCDTSAGCNSNDQYCDTGNIGCYTDNCYTNVSCTDNCYTPNPTSCCI